MRTSLKQFSPSQIAQTIKAAEVSVCIIAPGITLEMAEALCEVTDRNPGLSAKILLEVTPEICRLGYGFHEGVQQLHKRGIPIFHRKGIRLMLLVVDGSGWMVAPQPLLVETFDESSFVNCLELTPEQIENLYAQFFDEPTPVSNRPVEGAGPTAVMVLEDSLPVSEDHIDMVDQSLGQNPPQEFDLARKVSVFNSFVEFVELELKGASLNRRKLRLPSVLMDALADDVELRGRLTGAFQMLGKDNLHSSAELDTEIRKLRETYLKPMGKLGRVILRSKRPEFEKELSLFREKFDHFKSSLKESLVEKIENSLNTLVAAIAPLIHQKPPQALTAAVVGGVKLEMAEKFVREKLEKVIPTVDDLIKNLEITVIFKSVTYEMLIDAVFQEGIRSAYPYIDWDKPLEEFETLLPKLG